MCGDRWRGIHSDSDEDPAISDEPGVIQTSCVEKAVEHFRKSMEERKRVSTVLSALSFSSTPSENKTSSGFQHDSPRQQCNENNTTTTTIAAVAATSTIMSNSRLQDDFSSTLAGLERLSEDWGDVSISHVWKFDQGHSIVGWFKAVMSPQMSVPYNMIFKAFERLAAFRKQITYLNIWDPGFEKDIETLIRVMIKHIAASQLIRCGGSMLVDDSSWGDRVSQALDTWLLMRRVLITSVDKHGACAELLDRKFVQVLQKIHREVEATVIGLKQDVQELRDAEATVVSHEQEIERLKSAKQSVENAAKVSNKQLNQLRLSQSESANRNTMLIEELEKVRLSHMKKCGRFDELEVEMATSSQRSALSNGILQSTVRKLKSEIGVLEEAAIKNSDRKVYDTSYQSEALKSKELLAEAEEDLAFVTKANDKLTTEQQGLQDTLATLLQDKTAVGKKCEHLDIENAALRDSVEQSHRLIEKEKEELASANARLNSLLSKAKDENAALSESNENLVADGAKKDIELTQAAEFVSRLTDKREESEEQKALLIEESEKFKEEKARLEESLAEANESLDRATSTITATNMHNLTAVNLRLEEELKAANGIIGQIRSTLLPRSTPANTVNEVSAIHESPDTAAAKLIDLNENMKWPSEAPVDPFLVGDTESDAWSTTILTPPPGLDTPEVSYFPPIPRFDTFVADLTMKRADGAF